MYLMFTWFIEGKPRIYGAERIARPGVEPSQAVSASPPVEDGLSVDPNLRRNPYQKLSEASTPRERAILVSQIMTARVVSLSSGATITEAWKLFRERRFRHVPVVDQGVLVGILSDRDVLKFFAEADAMRQAEAVVRDIMTSRVLATRLDTRIRDAARVMLHERIGSMPVVDTEGNVVGILTRSDILRSVMNNVPLELWT